MWEKPDYQFRWRGQYYKTYHDASKVKNRMRKHDPSCRFDLIEQQGTRQLRIHVNDPIPSAVSSILRYYGIKSPDCAEIELASIPSLCRALEAHDVHCELIHA